MTDLYNEHEREPEPPAPEPPAPEPPAPTPPAPPPDRTDTFREGRENVRPERVEKQGGERDPPPPE